MISQAPSMAFVVIFCICIAFSATVAAIYSFKKPHPAPAPRNVKGTGAVESRRIVEIEHVKPICQDFDWTKHPEFPYRPWHNGPYHVTMGLKNTDIENWIEIDQTYLSRYQLKSKLYRDHREEVLQVLPGCEDEAFEALDRLIRVLVRRYPTMFKLIGKDIIQNLVTGDTWDCRRNASTWEKHHPLEVMGLLTTEDYFILTTDEQNQTTLRAAASCFPAGFKIEERIGLSLWQIHAANVPQYEQKLSKSMDRFFVKLQYGSPIQRFNFAVDISSELFHRHSHHNLSVESLQHPLTIDDLHLRVERQVLQRLPRTKGLLFSIRTYVTPIREVTQDLEVTRALRTSINSFTPDVSKYKNQGLWNELLQEHISSVLGADCSEETELSSKPITNHS